jgi:all-trans-retinol 13,14-reductase
MKYDIIIIGAGLGGLTAGAKLAKEGKKVLLLEQHSRPGGCATTFQRGDYTLEIGLHEMDGPGTRDMKTKIFNDLDVFEHVEFIKVPQFYRFINDRFEVTVPHDPSLACEQLSDLFPDESGGIKAYFEQILTPRKKATGDNIKDISLGEFLDSIIRNDDLKLILLGNLGYFHDDPYTLSLAYYSFAQGSYYSDGASYIKGGSQKLSDHLARFINDHGGEILLSHLVTGIKINAGRAESVTYRKKGNPEIIEAFADEIIANNAIPNLFDLIGGEKGSELKNMFSGHREGASLLTLYLGFRRSPRELGNKYYSTCLFDGSVKTQADIYMNFKDDFSRRSFIFVDYSQIDSGLTSGVKSTGSICCIDYPDDWAGLDRKDYIAKKEHVASVLIGRLDKLIPGIKDIIEYYETGTPSTIERYTLNPGGAVYGFAQTPSKEYKDPSKLVNNLHIASAWGQNGGGFSGAIYRGYMCTFNILRKKALK